MINCLYTDFSDLKAERSLTTESITVGSEVLAKLLELLLDLLLHLAEGDGRAAGGLCPILIQSGSVHWNGSCAYLGRWSSAAAARVQGGVPLPLCESSGHSCLLLRFHHR